MIASVSGRVLALRADAAIVEVGGVGLLVHATPATLARLRVGDAARLSTSLVVREDVLALYGFADDDERDLFGRLQTASGVGPRLALAMLAVHEPDALRRAVADGDITALMRVPGIGRKGAMKMVVELKDRLGAPSRAGDLPVADGWRDQVHAGLLGLGYSMREADEAVDAVVAEARAGADVPVLLKSALRTLSRAG